MDEKKETSKIELLSHLLLFAYQKTLRNLCVLPYTYLTHLVLESMKKISEEAKISFIKGKNLEEAFENYISMLKKSGLVENAQVEKLDLDGYRLHIDGCIYAKHIHPILNPKDLTCRFAFMAMMIYEKFSGKKVKLTDSEFTEKGTTTIIEPAE